jgi:N-acetylmuramoyl-L-alanine amidase
MGKIFDLLLSLLKQLFSKKEEKPVEQETTNIETSGNTQPINNEENNNEMLVKGNYNGTVILLDNGHASTTPGKRSPVWNDGYQFFEYEFNRDVVSRIAKELKKLGIKYEIITPEVDVDVKLTTRVNRVNNFCKKYGTSNCLLISVHANAGANGGWCKARGWSVYTTKGVTKSDAIATIFYNEAENLLPRFNMTTRKDMSDGDPDYEENFTIIYKSLCPAILTENLFMDNKEDCEFLRSDWGREMIARIHVNAIKKICGLE